MCYVTNQTCKSISQIFGLLFLSLDHWELLLELQEQQYLLWAKRSTLYNLEYLLSHSARLYQSPMICTRSNCPRSAPSREQCRHLEVTGIFKVGPVFSNKFDPLYPHNRIRWKLMHSKSLFPRIFYNFIYLFIYFASPGSYVYKKT